jgi:hypothetical protein
MGEKNKRPKRVAGMKPSAQKKPAALAASVERPTITWRFGIFDHDGPWPLHGVLDADHRELLEKLGTFETMRFDELIGSRGLKYIPIAKLDTKAQRRLEEINRDDVDGLWELHVKGLPRMWGVRDGEVMSFLWWDPKHEVCPSHLRNT